MEGKNKASEPTVGDLGEWHAQQQEDKKRTGLRGATSEDKSKHKIGEEADIPARRNGQWSKSATRIRYRHKELNSQPKSSEAGVKEEDKEKEDE